MREPKENKIKLPGSSGQNVSQNKDGGETVIQGQIHTVVTARISDQLQIIAISASIQDMTGFPASHFLGKKIADAPFFESKNEKIIAEVQSAFESGEARQFFIILNNDSRRIFGAAVPLLSASGKVEEVALSLRELQNHINESNFRKLFEQSPTGICFIGLDKHFLDVNPALLRLWGYPKEDLLTKSMVEVTHPEDVKKSLKYTRQIDNNEISHFTLEKRYIRKDGSTMWGRVTASAVRDEEGKIIYHIATVEDITDSHLANEALDNERSLLNAIMDSTADAIYMKDTESRFVRVNKGVLDKYNFSKPEQIIGKTDFDFFPAELAQQDYDDERRIVQTGEPLLNLEGIEVWSDRPPTWVSTTKVPMRDHEGKIVGTLGISRDITDRKQNEEEILQLNKSLEKKVEARTKDLVLKNKELEEFTYTVSHDLKAPLRGISGYSSLLLQEHANQLDEEGKGFLEKLILSSEQLSLLIDDLLTYSRLEKREVTFSTISMAEVVKVNLDQFRSEINNRNVTIHLEMDASPIQSSYDLMMTIVHNLIDNALKFTSRRPQPEIWIVYREMGESSLLSVRDNGIGFDSAYAEKIFDVFQRLNHSSEYSGTGIGLAMVKKAADMLNYQVWAEGKVDGGATFYLKNKHQLHL